MARRATGTVDVDILADGTRAFRLRFRADGRRERLVLHERRGCGCGCGGGWTRATAAIELDNVMAKVRAGVWTPPERRAPAVPTAPPTFHEYASYWLQAKIDGALGDQPIDRNTQTDYLWRLRRHLLPFFGHRRLDEIDRELCLRFKATKLRDAAELRDTLAAGAEIRDRAGRRARPLSPSSIKKLIDTLGAVLDDAVEDGHLDHNPARGKRMRVRVPKPARTFLEMDELVALMDAASELDGAPPRQRSRPPMGAPKTRDRVAELVTDGLRPAQIADRLGLARATVSFHLARLAAEPATPYAGRRAIVATLGYSGVRVSELCDLRIGDIRLHERDGARLHIADAKTEAGIRDVQLSPDLVEELVAHLDALRRVGQPTGPDAFAFPNLRGGRLDRQRVGKIVREAQLLASDRLTARGLPPLPTTTPHSLRRTYISTALLATGFDVLFVMSQVGHADSKMTTDVYAQLQHRVKRDHGRAFDQLVQRAREQLEGADLGVIRASNGTRNGTEAGFLAPGRSSELSVEREEPRDLQGSSEVARPGLEPGTPRFSVVCSTN